MSVRVGNTAARVVGVLIIAALGVALVVLRCGGRGERSGEAIEAATRALRLGLSGDAAGMAQARTGFAEASAGVVFSPYPLFALEVVEVLGQAQGDRAALTRVLEAARPVFVAWLEGRFEDALVLAAKLPVDSGGEHLARLARDLVRVSKGE
ncbi:MAG TPA: hypothetical protein PK095_22335 [Myxococcota bacterium]|nr:hypothetical protein [Myxococcota bacterium]